MFSGLDNIVDPDINSGSMFGIWRRVTTKCKALSEKEDILQNCGNMLVGGYCMYGTSMQIILAIN